MISRRIARSLACLLLLTLAGCGFHPRGEIALPEGMGPVTVVTGAKYTILYNGLVHALEPANAAFAKSPDAKPVTLRVVSEVFRTDPLSVSALAQVQEFIVTYAVKISLTTSDGTDLLPLQEIRLQRDFSYDVYHALGSGSEQTTLNEELQRDMAANIIRRVDIALRNAKR